MTQHDQVAAADYAAQIAGLDLRTKIRLLTGASAFTLAPEPSIRLAEVIASDGPTGVRGLQRHGGKPVTLFPNATLLASAWSEELAYEVGSLLAEEAMAQHIHVVLGPTVNLHRSVLGGRLFEAYSEDPLISDWYATRSAAPAANGGLDLVMPGPIGPWGAALVRAVETGEVGESVIDEHVRRVLRLADRVGALGAPREWPGGLPAPDSATRKEQMRRLAAAGMTVLTNRDGTLPLDLVSCFEQGDLVTAQTILAEHTERSKETMRAGIEQAAGT